VRASACQAALGVACAGPNLIKFGLAEQSLDAAIYLADSIVRTVRTLGPAGKKLYPAVFVDEDMCRFFKPFKHSLALATKSKADGILIDTFNKLIGKGLLDYCKLHQIADLARTMHRHKKELWIAGSITKEELPGLWATGVDVICVRGAACESTGKGRFGKVKADIVRELVKTIPK
jgi:(5-formylfuran-3-yl)methyl phosphate synthase